MEQNQTFERDFSSKTPIPPPPDSYLALAILSTVLCCLPFGIVSIVYASKVNSLYAAQQYEAAEAASKSAKKWGFISIGSGIAIIVLYLLFVVLLGVASGLNNL